MLFFCSLTLEANQLQHVALFSPSISQFGVGRQTVAPASGEQQFQPVDGLKESRIGNLIGELAAGEASLVGPIAHAIVHPCIDLLDGSRLRDWEQLWCSRPMKFLCPHDISSHAFEAM